MPPTIGGVVVAALCFCDDRSLPVTQAADRMLSAVVVIASSFAWLLLMFVVAVIAERRPLLFASNWRYVYALSLAVHCTSWTFYGTVTQAARYGWPLPPTFIGAFLRLSPTRAW